MQSNFMMAESKKKGPLGSGQKEEAGSRSLKPYPDEEVGMIDYARMGLRIRTRRREFNMTQEQRNEMLVTVKAEDVQAMLA